MTDTANPDLPAGYILHRFETVGSTMDLIGVPWQIIVGPKGVQGGFVEMKNRKTGDREELSAEAALARLAG